MTEFGSIDFLTGKDTEAARAFKVAIGTSQFERNITAFEKICLALNGMPVDFEHHQIVEIPYICWAVEEIRQFKVLNFSEDIKKYIETALRYFDYTFAPYPLNKYVDYQIPEEILKQADPEEQRKKELACKYYVEQRLSELNTYLSQILKKHK